MASVLSRSAIVAPKNFNRWLIPPAALAIHLCIGQVYAFSVFKIPFMTHFDAGEVSIGWIFSIAILMLGISSAVFGPWVEKNGPRASMAAAGTCWVVGFFVASLGIMTGQLWLVYLGYGVIGGIGLGIGYISPVSTLMKWFPDRPGLATGLAIMGFGGGALIASPMSNQLMSLYGGGTEPENLVAGLTPTFVTLGIVYAVVITAGAFVIRVPHPEWTPKNFDPSKATAKPMQTQGNVSVRNAIRTPQFWLLWVALFLNVTAGIGILENAAPMAQAYFGITAAAAAGYVGLLSIGNMAGRFVWSTTSDYLGRKNNYMLYLGGGLILYLAVALFGGSSLVLFILATLVIISFYGGGFSTVPAYLKDLFGVYQVGAIHGALLTAWSAAGVAGPLIVNSVVEAGDKAGKTGPELYTPGMYIMVGALAVGFIANALIRPVSKRHFERAETVKAKQAAALEDEN
ncbi:MAG: OFA family MFS transporter [Brevibacterium sp.]|uniref:L-lactate MFS transporter n=1 Tax=Brevibacterium sp. TaxID=1701 RepID=UPI0026498634|nr:OFA family MFS transporter [Brevibacterium sp.]MDN5807582.1 OFA family MFS transporter [Brevibacterium sp.]MDN5833192.1 OFA family MFS transporter [Brevibacterium sp.]MDN5875706.1 OFA family MFS transporter [Brevibacterium sp.]MDN5909538.1 OFA family MFS transporter [Brevibacterium sp.]MDN6133561.1 OFA family MFS transporter [Brevibacterium sp.]